jgi:hypothetical protein
MTQLKLAVPPLDIHSEFALALRGRPEGESNLFFSRLKSAKRECSGKEESAMKGQTAMEWHTGWGAVQTSVAISYRVSRFHR